MLRKDGPSVLVPAKYTPDSYACLRSLAPRGIHTVVASPYESIPAFVSRYCDEAVVVPSPQEDMLGYKEAMVSLASRSDIRTIIPVWIADTYLLSKYRAEFEEHVSLVVPPFQTLRTVYDRVHLIEAANEAGVPTPKTWVLDEVPDWDHELIIKSRYNLLVEEFVDSLEPGEFALAKTVTHLEPSTEPDLKAIRTEMNHTPIVQEFVRSSDEYLFGALYNRGEAVATFQHRQIRGETYAGGGGSYRESVYEPQLEKAGRTLLDHLDWHGFACIEYMRDAETGEFVLTEINPRTWRSFAFAVRTGADFPYYYWLVANGKADRVESGYEVGVGGHFLHGEFQYLLSVLRDEYPNAQKPTLPTAIQEIASSLYAQPHFDYLYLDDPKPFVHGILSALAR